MQNRKKESEKFITKLLEQSMNIHRYSSIQTNVFASSSIFSVHTQIQGSFISYSGIRNVTILLFSNPSRFPYPSLECETVAIVSTYTSSLHACLVISYFKSRHRHLLPSPTLAKITSSRSARPTETKALPLTEFIAN